MRRSFSVVVYKHKIDKTIVFTIPYGWVLGPSNPSHTRLGLPKCIFWTTYLLYISTSGFQSLCGGILMSSTFPYSDLFHFKLTSVHSWDTIWIQIMSIKFLMTMFTYIWTKRIILNMLDIGFRVIFYPIINIIPPNII